MSIPGPFLAGQRLTAGQLNDATQKTILSVEVGNSGTLYTTSSTTELNMPKFAMSGLQLVNGGLYELAVHLFLQNSVGTDTYNLIVRHTTALSGALVTDWVIPAPAKTTQYDFSTWDDIVSAADVTRNYFFSVQRLSGTGTLSVLGQGSSTNRPGVKLMRTGYSSEYSLVT